MKGESGERKTGPRGRLGGKAAADRLCHPEGAAAPIGTSVSPPENGDAM